MDNNQNMGQFTDNQAGYAPQQGFVQPQQGFVQPQQGFAQPQQGFVQPQQGFAQPQQGFAQPQMQYQNMQQPYGQQPYGQSQMNYGQQPYGQPSVAPKKPLNKKAIGIGAAVVLVIILAIVFVPKLFGGSSSNKTPFDKVKLGMTKDEVKKVIDMDDDYDDDTWYDRECKAFGVEGRLQIVFDYDGVVDRINWYVDEDDCESSKAYDKAVEDIKEYYTDKYGKPEKDGDEYNWELPMNLEYELEMESDGFVLRYR